MRYLAIIALSLASLCSKAGDPTDSLKHSPVRYVFSINSGMTFCSSCSLEGSTVAMPTTIQGIQWKRFRVGGGIGYTSYGPIRVMPYFGSISFNLYGNKWKNGPFIEMSYGKGRAWLSDLMNSDQTLKGVSCRSFFQISTGYAFHYYKLRLAAQIGFQSLNASRRYEYVPVPEGDWFFNYTVLPPNRTYEYNINRAFVALSIGI